LSKKRSGIQLIAELASVSIGTVDRALHGRAGIAGATRRRIQQIARQVGYTPNLAARALSISKANIKIGVCIPREIRFFYDQLWSGVLEEARQAAHLGIQFLNRPVEVLGEGDAEAVKELIAAEVQGIILTAGNPRGLQRLINRAEQKGIRVVCVSTDAPKSQRSCVVCVEPRMNGCLAGELMGKVVAPDAKVAIVAGMLRAEDHQKKVEGFKEAFPKYCAEGRIVKIIEGHEAEDETFQKTA
jgi:LacI family transcriptional regulator